MEPEGVSRTALLRHADVLVAHLRKALSSSPEAGLTATPPNQPIPAGARAAAVLAPLYVRDSAPCLLFTQRSLALPAHKGEISFPGGSRETSDRSLAAAALRETYEELGIEPDEVEILGPLPPVFAAVSNYFIQPFVGWLGQGLPPLHPNPAEVAELIEAPLAALAQPEIYHTELWQRGGVEHLVHFYDFGAYRIWGATARMLYSVLELLPAE